MIEHIEQTKREKAVQTAKKTCESLHSGMLAVLERLRNSACCEGNRHD